MSSIVFSIVAFTLLAVAMDAPRAGAGGPQLPIAIERPERDQPVDFHREVMPLLRKNCVACHHAQAAEGGLNLESIQQMIAGGDSGPAIVVGDGEASLLVSRASGQEEPLMPPEDNSAGAVPLTPAELGLIALWIEQGASAGQPMAGDQGPQWQPIAGAFRPIYALETTPNGRYTVAGYGNSVVVFDRHRQQLAGRLIDPSLPAVAGDSAADVDLVQAIAVSPDNQWIATGGYRSLRLWRETYPTLLRDQWGEAPATASLAALKRVRGAVLISADRQYLASSTTDHSVQVIASSSGEPVLRLVGHRAPLIGGGLLVDPAVAEAATSGEAAAALAGRLVSVDARGRLLSWNLADGVVIAETQTDTWPVSVAVSPDLRRVAIVAAGGDVRLWEMGDAQPPAWQAATGDSLAAITDANAVAWLPGDSPALLVATDSAGLQHWDASGQSLVRTYDHGGAVLLVATDPQGGRIVTAGGDGVSKVWNAADGALLTSLRGDPQRLQLADQLAGNLRRQEGKLGRLSGHSDELAKRLEGESAALAQAIEARDKADETAKVEVEKLVAANQAVTDGEAKITAADGQVAELEAKLKALADEMAAVTAEIEAKKQESTQATADLEEKKKAVTTATQAKQQAETAAETAQATVQANTDAEARLKAQIATHDAVVADEKRYLAALARTQTRQQSQWPEHAALATSIAFASDGSQLATAHQDGAVRVYFNDQFAEQTAAAINLQATNHDHRLDAHPQLFFVDDNRTLLALGGSAGQVWQLQPNWELVRQIGTPEESPISDRVTAIDFDPTSQRVVVGSGPASRSGQVLLFSLADGSLIHDFGAIHSDTVLSVRFSPDGDRLATSAADRAIRVISLSDNRVLRTLEGHTHHVMGLAWNDDAVTLASAGADQTVKIWNSETGQQHRTIAGIPKEVTALRYLPASSQLMTAAADGHLRLYNADDGKAIRTFAADGDFLFALTLSADGAEVSAGGQSGVLRFWKVEDGTLVGRWPAE